jgi:DNA-binding response OmpR family regulator
VAQGQNKPFSSQVPGAIIWWLDDDVELSRQMRPRLLASGWELKSFPHPEPFIAALGTSHPDLLVLDQRLPAQLGTDLLRNLRVQGHVFPVLMLSGMGSPEDRILGLEQGAQDYLVKPFHARELLLRCEQLLRSDQRIAIAPVPQEQRIPLGDVTFRPHEGCLQKTGHPAVILSRGDRKLLLALCRAPGRVLTREQLARASGSLAPVGHSRSIDVRLSRLRRLLTQASAGSLRIETVRTHGYALRTEATPLSTEEPSA